MCLFKEHSELVIIAVLHMIMLDILQSKPYVDLHVTRNMVLCQGHLWSVSCASGFGGQSFGFHHYEWGWL